MSTTPGTEICASIDVGTNSVKMLLAKLNGENATLLFDQSAVTRLGEGMVAGRLREVPIRRTLDALDEFVGIAKEKGAQRFAAVGTAALRDAENRDDFLHRAQERCGLAVEVIPGEEEARLSYLAVRRDAHWRNCRQLLVVDIGGGSTEIIFGEPDSDRLASRVSIGVGAVRLTESCLRSDPPTIAQLSAANKAAAEKFAPVQQDLAGRMRELNPDNFRLVGVGGTMTNLAAMDIGGLTEPEKLHGYTLHADDLDRQITLLASSTVEARKQIPGLDPRRADIILGGALLLSQALACISSSGIDISTRGLRWGVLYDRLAPKRA